ncbi:CU044_5270 family protein [Nonomuraea sp. NPDC023979]|uniref:CU044_5270 family protein n=1 Tax=Nonomuraea sp. NPDC023979 TaxID=3154796 RepID=UPI0033F9E4DA
MDEEFKEFADGRPAVPPYPPEARFRAREALMREARRGRGLRLPRFGWQAVAAFGVTVTLVGGVAVALSGQNGQSPVAGSSVTRAAAQFFPELRPRPGQFILIESDTMYASFQAGEDGEESRHLYRTHRKIYRSVDGSADGLLYIEGRPPEPWPGRELPAVAHDWKGSGWNRLASCPGRMGDQRDDYAYLSGLDAAALRALIRRDAPPGKADAAQQAFDAAAELVRESYLPRAQREALFQEIKAIPGVTEADGVADSAGRRGVALGLPASDGTLRQLIFDRGTYSLLGERATVVDARAAEAPEGSLLAHTAQLNVTVVDRLPEVDSPDGDDSCEGPDESASPAPTEDVPAEDVPTETAAPAEDAPTEDVPTETAAPAEDFPAAEPTPIPSESRPEVPAEDFPVDESASPTPAGPMPTPTG